MKLTRVYRFAASHRLHAESLSCEQNEELYGKCNNPYGHGHDYVLHISVEGEPEPETGRVIDIGALDRYVDAKLLRFYDHSDLNHDVPNFAGVPTTENLAVDCMRRLSESWPFPTVAVRGVVIRETERNTIQLETN